MAAAATLLPFLGVSTLSGGSFSSPAFLLPVIVGLIALGALVVRQYRKPAALMPVKLLMHTLPVTGISVAMVAGAAVTTLAELAVVYLLDVAHLPPLLAGSLLTPQIVGMIAAAWLFKVALRTRWLPVLAFTGLAAVTVGGALLMLLGQDGNTFLLAGAGLVLGFGAGAGVAPGLFLGGLSVPSNRLGPTFALVELLRSEAAYVVAPVLLHVAMSSRNLVHGVQQAILATVVLAGGGAVVLLGVLLLGGARPHRPDLTGWLSGESSAFHSPKLGAVLRDNAGQRAS